jgi:hypothetical protein
MFSNINGFLTHNIGIAIIFAFIYMFYVKYYSSNKDNEFNGLNSSSSLIDFLYFSLTIQSTVGFGDHYPISQSAKILVMLQQSTLLYELSTLFKL